MFPARTALRTRLLSVAISVMAPTLVIAPGAEAVERRTSYEEVVKEFKSVNCEGKTLDACSTPQSEALKALIRERVEAGWTKDEIIEAVVDEFGQQILAVTPRRGIVWGLWLMPAAVLAVGALVAMALVKRGSRRERLADPVPDGSMIDPEVMEEIERAVQEDV